MNLSEWIANRYNERILRRYRKRVHEIRAFGAENWTVGDVRERSADLRQRAMGGEPLDRLLPEAYAAATAAMRLKTGIALYDEQLLAAIGLHEGRLVEMKTGEGKTAAAVLPAYLHALPGRGMHVMTFNDYLAGRDAAWMGPVYELLGVSVASVCEGMSADAARAAYAADITYLTAKQGGFHYLQDAMCCDADDMLQRPYNAVIVDEADSILLDEARVPLVIAGESEDHSELQRAMAGIAKQLRHSVHYHTDAARMNVYLTDSGAERAEQLLGCGNLYELPNAGLLAVLTCALHAQALLSRDVDYIVRDGKVELVDEFTGRVADKRRWPDGLQAAVEAKEGLELQPSGRILNSLTLQHLMQLYPQISGMTATAWTSSIAFKEIYDMEVVVIPQHQPSQRVDHPPYVFTHAEAKYATLVQEIAACNKSGRPVLIGTVSVEESERLSKGLQAAGLAHQVLNAKNDMMEAEIIADAGAYGAITVSTNMAGRGVDIRLGGRNGEQQEQVCALGGLYVIGTSMHESARVDNQLKGRAGRQGDPGETRQWISLEDTLLQSCNFADVPEASARSDAPIRNERLIKRIQHFQKVMEGEHHSIQLTLNKYADLVEEHRRVLQHQRQLALHGQAPHSVVGARNPELYTLLQAKFGEAAVCEAERQAMMYAIDQSWCEYLEQVADIREGIHLERIGRNNPLSAYTDRVIQLFATLPEMIENHVLQLLESPQMRDHGRLDDSKQLKRPSSTWTYTINDQFKSSLDFSFRRLFTKGQSAFGKI